MSDRPGPSAPAPEEGAPVTETVAGGMGGTSGRRVLAGSAWNVASLVAPQVWTLVLSVAAARFLGPALLGRQSFIAFVELSLMTLATGGVPLGVMRWVGEFRGRDRADAVPALLRWAWRVEGLGALACAGVLVGVGLVDGRHVPAWALAAAAGAIGVLHAVPAAVLRGLHRWREASIVGMTTGGLGAAATIAVLAAGGGIAAMFAVEVVVSAANLAWTASLARRGTAGLPDDGGAGFAEARPAVVRYVGGLSVEVILTLIVFRRSEFLFLDRYASDADIAFYSVAFAAVVAGLRVFEGVAGVLAPAFAELVGAGASGRIREGFGRAFRLVATVALVGSAGLAVVGPRLIEVAYGPEFRPARQAFSVLVTVLPFVAVAGLTHAVLVGFGRVRVVLVSSFAAAVVNIVLDVVLISRYEATGAAVANNVAQVVAGLPVVVVAWRAVGGLSWRAASVAATVATALATAVVAGGVLRAVGGAPGAAAALLAGSAVAAAGMVASVRRQPDDAAWLASTLPGRLGALVAGTRR